MAETFLGLRVGPMEIRRAIAGDFEAIWPILQGVIRRGDTFAYDASMTADEGRALWMESPEATVVAVEGGAVVGSYVLRKNQPGRGSHVANAAYLVDEQWRGQGIGRALCEHSLTEARAMGFRAMQFNLVVSTNVGAIALWQSCGFRTLCVLPGAFRHPDFGFVDALVMYQELGEVG